MSTDPPNATTPKMHPKRLANPTAKCPKAGGRKGKQVNDLLRVIWAQGFWIDEREHSYKCFHPDADRQPTSTCGVPKTPGEGRSWPNTIGGARRAGVDI